MPSMTRVFSGVQPTGDMHLGGYLGAFRHWTEDQHQHDSFFCVVDLHALTVEQDPTALRERTLGTAMVLLALGLDPDVCTLFLQSHVHEHTELSWLMECTAGFGELRRMTQFKEKSTGQEAVSAGLFTYPALMAADILLYDTDRVPVGDDQRQHLELCRDLAQRFNHRYGETFVVPEAAIPRVGARVMDLQDPTRKMSKSVESPQGTVLVLDEPAAVERKIKRAVTDTGTEVRYDPGSKPGVSNLLEILGAATGRSPNEAAEGYRGAGYGRLKSDVADAVVELLTPVRERYAELSADPAGVAAILAKGAAKASDVAAATLVRAKEAVGLVPPQAGRR
jgi:tryptophanyl-tRNA synthetase